MFKLAELPKTRKVEIKLDILADGEEHSSHTMTVEVRIDGLKEIDETRTAVVEEAKKLAAAGTKVSAEVLFVRNYIVGWEDIEDANGPMPYTQENLDAVLNIPDARVAIVKAVAAHVNREDLLQGNS